MGKKNFFNFISQSKNKAPNPDLQLQNSVAEHTAAVLQSRAEEYEQRMSIFGASYKTVVESLLKHLSSDKIRD